MWSGPLVMRHRASRMVSPGPTCLCYLLLKELGVTVHVKLLCLQLLSFWIGGSVRVGLLPPSCPEYCMLMQMKVLARGSPMHTTWCVSRKESPLELRCWSLPPHLHRPAAPWLCRTSPLVGDSVLQHYWRKPRGAIHSQRGELLPEVWRRQTSMLYVAVHLSCFAL